jgi:hypothetical protein
MHGIRAKQTRVKIQGASGSLFLRGISTVLIPENIFWGIYFGGSAKGID